ncbi:DMT family transporter [Alkalicoccus daliensis]|uniref:Threonine/homoserine efflux transporter RhtA n=1 Tax=Alkalicoccus daliensis TaxID=745820 RepID=A0A1H0AD29_9BACI|nr:DMT family transporter [Alkalicoccus daliensis]SDN31479.1 Threonine/homoserine efflux transporter RhtA [Alkalicoccus daliensis]
MPNWKKVFEDRPVLIYIMLAAATSSWGSAFIAGSIATEDLGPVTVAFLRFLFATAVLIPVMLTLDPGGRRPKGKEWFLILFLGLTGIALYNILFFIATRDAPIIKSSLFIASNPVLIIVLSGLFLKETISKNNIVGLIIAFLGAGLIITEGNLKRILEAGLEPIDIVLFLAVICWAAYSVIGKIALQKFSAVTSTTYAVTAGTLMLLPIAVYETAWTELLNTSIYSWIAILHMSVIVSVISFIMYYQGIKLIGAARASIFINFMPLTAVILAVIFLGEPLLPVHVIGAALVLGGVTYGTRR